MGSGDAEGVRPAFRHCKGDEGTAVPGNHVFPAFFNVPGVLFPDFRKSGIEERFLHTVDCMKYGGGAGDEMNQVFAHFNGCLRLFHVHYFLWFTFLWYTASAIWARARMTGLLVLMEVGVKLLV